jgi:hypothetical protein
VASRTAHACSCLRPGTPCESYGSAAAVFVGTPISVREADRSNQKDVDWTPKAFKFSVEQSYLGVEGTEIEVFTGRGGGDCGYGFRIGERYLVYASNYQNRLTTGICSRTTPFSKATDDLAFLGTLSSATPGATIYGQVVRNTPPKTNTPPINEDIVVKIEGDNVRREIHPDPHGHYRVAGLTAGKFKVALQLPETFIVSQPEREVSISDRGCASVVYYISENGRMSGRVVDEAGQPVARILVSVVPSGSDPKAAFVTLDRTDDEGQFNFSAIPSGRYLIAVNFNRYPEPNDTTNAYPPAFYPGVVDQTAAEVISLGMGEKRTGLDIRISARRPSSVLAGQIVWTDGSPVGTALLAMRDDSQSDSGIRHGVEVDARGKFTINGYVGQKLILEAHSNRNEPKERSEVVRITLARPSETVKIVIPKVR